MAKSTAETPITVKGFLGITSQELVKKVAKKHETKVDQVLTVLNHPRFEEFMAVVEAIGQRELWQLDEEDANDSILLDYFELTSDSIARAIDGDEKDERKKLSPYAIDAARAIITESGLHPHLGFQDLPPLDKIDGRAPWQRTMQRYVNKYDHNGVVPKDLYE